MPQILLCGSEGEQFVYGNALNTLGADERRRGSVRLEQGDEMFRMFDTGVLDMWAHARIALVINTGTTGPSGDLPFFSVLSGGNAIASVQSFVPSSSSGRVRFTGPTLGVGPVASVGHLSFENYDINVKIEGGNTHISIYKGDSLRYRTILAGEFIPDAVRVQAHSQYASLAPTYIQDVIVTDGIPTVGMELVTLVPGAVGNYSEFANDYTAFSTPGYNSTTAITSDAPGERESWILGESNVYLGNKTVYGLVMNTVAQTDLLGVIDDFRPLLRINATDYLGAPIGADYVAPRAIPTVWQTNPATGMPWAVSELVGLEAGIQST